MSTPRCPKCGSDRMDLASRDCWGKGELHPWHQAEGVAAPLEPTPEQFIESRLVPPLLHGDEAHQEWLRGELRKWIPDLKLWAAAVSKNLREKLTKSEDRYTTLLHQRYENMAEFRFRGMTHEELTRKLEKISDLEKEIAALRKAVG